MHVGPEPAGGHGTPSETGAARNRWPTSRAAITVRSPSLVRRSPTSFRGCRRNRRRRAGRGGSGGGRRVRAGAAPAPKRRCPHYPASLSLPGPRFALSSSRSGPVPSQVASRYQWVVEQLLQGGSLGRATCQSRPVQRRVCQSASWAQARAPSHSFRVTWRTCTSDSDMSRAPRHTGGHGRRRPGGTGGGGPASTWRLCGYHWTVVPVRVTMSLTLPVTLSLRLVAHWANIWKVGMCYIIY